MALLTKQDLARQSPAAWACLGLLVLCAVALWVMDRHGAAGGTMLSVLGGLGLLLPPRERMAHLPRRIRLLSRRLDAAPILAGLLSCPGYGLGWFYGANPYDETVHLLSGVLAGAVLAGLLETDGKRRSVWRRAWLGTICGFALAAGWEVFEAAASLSGTAIDTASDIALTTFGTTLGASWIGPWILHRQRLRPLSEHPEPVPHACGHL